MPHRQTLLEHVHKAFAALHHGPQGHCRPALFEQSSILKIRMVQMQNSLVPAALRYVDQVARAGSIQRAAKELNIAASAINRQILKLENELGVTLFERFSKGMRLTSAGNSVVALARGWKSDERRVGAELEQMQGVNQGHVRLVAMDSHANGYLPRLIGELAVRHPGVSLEVRIESTDEAVAALVDGSADLIAAFNLTPHRSLHILWTRDLPFGCVVAPDHVLARKKTVSMQEVMSYPVALQSKLLPIRRYLESHHAWLFAKDRTMVETNSLQLIKILAASGRHVAFTSELDAAPEIIEGALVFRPVRDKSAEPQKVSVALDSRKPLSKVVKIVADLLAEEMDQDLEMARKKRTD
jgi:DNA-binding transcriptional LysR family regulator